VSDTRFSSQALRACKSGGEGGRVHFSNAVEGSDPRSRAFLFTLFLDLLRTVVGCLTASAAQLTALPPSGKVSRKGGRGV
jgi:hypothetical protein